MDGFVLPAKILIMKVSVINNKYLISIVRTACNRCGRGQVMYKSPSIQSANELSQSKFLTNIVPLPFTNSQINLTNGHLLNEQFTFTNHKEENGYLSPPNLSPLKYSHSHSPKPKKNEGMSENKKKKKPFVEREGDWICFKCKNLNFAFRTNCNRCHLTKNENQKIIQQYMTNYTNFKTLDSH